MTFEIISTNANQRSRISGMFAVDTDTTLVWEYIDPQTRNVQVSDEVADILTDFLEVENVEYRLI